MILCCTSQWTAHQWIALRLNFFFISCRSV